MCSAQEKGEFDNLAGQGKPLILDDNSHVPAELRTAYRLLKNSGYLPPELEMRREAIELDSLLRKFNPAESDYDVKNKRLILLEMKLRQAGMSTAFLSTEYQQQLQRKFAKEE
ncbi:hypothetical protein ED28_11460 [[Pantoea] beijingensis]|uniref:DnaJ homologue subfamily C member 28 conserved domain-containing protein n=2 Tax=[Pantoea] beijingensis TaxID=1324864 RepID=A0A443ICZ7_9GAMM|nr:hypothetical protein ED28_11460 [[Pantoea] beijingensis]